MKIPLRTITIVLIAATAAMAAKPLNWQTGKVLDTERNRYFAGTIASSSSSGSATTTGTTTANGDMTTGTATTNGTAWGTHSSTAVYRVYETLVIEGEDYVYVANERLRWRWSHSANLAVNGPVKYAVVGRKLIVIDDDGKEHTMEIIKRILRQGK
jgi:hypothetical protein